MKQGRRRGFTIIEVILFLGISGLLLLVAFTFTASSIRNTRFSDATKSLENFIKDQYTRVQTNSLSLNGPAGFPPTCSSIFNTPVTTPTTQVADDGTGTSNNCILLGAVIDIYSNAAATTPATGGFNGSTYRGVVIKVSPVLGYSDGTSRDLSQSNPQIWPAAAEIHQLAWQSQIVRARAYRPTGVGTILYPSRIAIIRDTQSEKINFYTIQTSPATLLSIPAGDFRDTPSGSRNIPTLLCVGSDDGGSMRGAIRINGSGREQGVGLNIVTSSVVSQSEAFFTNVYSAGLACN